MGWRWRCDDGMMGWAGWAGWDDGLVMMGFKKAGAKSDPGNCQLPLVRALARAFIPPQGAIPPVRPPGVSCSTRTCFSTPGRRCMCYFNE